MKKKLVWAVGALSLVVLIVGACFLYEKLSGGYTPDRLAGTAGDENAGASASGDRSGAVNGGESDVDTDSASADEAQAAPDFTVVDYDGGEVKLSDYFGTPIVLNFWASWCPPCKSEMPDFDAASETHSEVLFLMVNMTDGVRETVETAKEHVESQGYGFTVLFDTEYSAAYAYYVNSLPATYFIDRDGNLIAYAQGMIDAEALERGIGMIAE